MDRPIVSSNLNFNLLFFIYSERNIKIEPFIE